VQFSYLFFDQEIDKNFLKKLTLLYKNHQKKPIFELFLPKNKKILIKQHISRDFIF